MRIPSGVTDQYIYFVAVDSTDFTTRETGLSSFTVYRSRNGGTSAAMTTPTINETDTTNMPGVYELLCDEDMTIDSGDDSQEMVFHITHTGMAPVTRTIELYRPKITAGETLGVAASTTLATGTHNPQTGDAYARLGAPAGASTAADIAAVKTDTAAILLDTGTDGVIVATNNDKTGYALSAAGVDAIFDEPTAGHVTAGTYGVAVTDILADTNELQTDDIPGLIAALNDPTAAAIADAVWDEAIAGHLGVGSTGEALNGASAPTAAEVADAVWDEAIAGHVGAGSTGEALNDVSGDIAAVSSAIGALNDLSAAEVNAEVVDALATDTYAEPGQGSPAATASLKDKIGYTYKFLRNKVETTATQISVYDDAGTTVDHKSTISDDTTTFTRGEYTTGP